MTDERNSTDGAENNNGKLDMSAFGELVPVNNVLIGNVLTPSCNARDLHVCLGVRRMFAAWITGRIAKYEFTEGVDYISKENLSYPDRDSSKARPQRIIDYHLTLDMAKELAMVENNEAGRAVRRYFIECERRANGLYNPSDMPMATDPAWRRWLALSTNERRTRQRDAELYDRAYGPPGMRIAMHQVGMPLLPSWAVGSRENYELDLTIDGTTPKGGH